MEYADFFNDPLGWALENRPDDCVKTRQITEDEWEEKNRTYWENE